MSDVIVTVRSTDASGRPEVLRLYIGPGDHASIRCADSGERVIDTDASIEVVRSWTLPRLPGSKYPTFAGDQSGHIASAESVVAAILALHRKVEGEEWERPRVYCAECITAPDMGTNVEWPCPTIRAITDTPEETKP